MTGPHVRPPAEPTPASPGASCQPWASRASPHLQRRRLGARRLKDLPRDQTLPEDPGRGQSRCVSTRGWKGGRPHRELPGQRFSIKAAPERPECARLEGDSAGVALSRGLGRWRPSSQRPRSRPSNGSRRGPVLPPLGPRRPALEAARVPWSPAPRAEPSVPPGGDRAAEDFGVRLLRGSGLESGGPAYPPVRLGRAGPPPAHPPC